MLRNSVFTRSDANQMFTGVNFRMLHFSDASTLNATPLSLLLLVFLLLNTACCQLLRFIWHTHIYIYIYGGKQWQTTPTNLSRMQCARAIPVTWLGSGSSGTDGFTSPPKEGVLRIFFALKNPTASAGIEPANLGTKGQHATRRPPEPLGFIM